MTVGHGCGFFSSSQWPAQEKYSVALLPQKQLGFLGEKVGVLEF